MATAFAVTASAATSTNGFAQSGVTHFKAEGQFTGNRSAAVLARVFVPIASQYGDSDLAVDVDFTMDRLNGKVSLSVKGAVPAGAKLDRVLTCDTFSVSKQSEVLYMPKTRETDELKNGGVNTDTIVRAECVDQKHQAANAVVIYDEDGYTVLLNDVTPGGTNPRFDVIVGAIPTKK